MPQTTETPAPQNENLTREEAATRAAALRVDAYRVAVDFSAARDHQVTGFSSQTSIDFTVIDGSSSTFLDFIHESVQSITLNGAELDPATAVVGSRIMLDGLTETNTVTVCGTASYSRSGEGLHRYLDPADGQTYLYTQYEPADARRVFANFEQPDLKAPFSFTVTAPTAWHVASNQSASSITELEGGISTTVFAPTLPISTYITVLLAGPYHVVRSNWSGTMSDGSTLDIPLALTCRTSLASALDPEELFDVTRRGLDYFHEQFDYPYPWGKYDQAFVPEYNLGAMENPGLVTFTEAYVFSSRATIAQREGRANTIMHEMAHMWFGDLVTMSWWDDLWLKESFADYIGTLAVDEATAFDTAWVTFANRRKAWAYVQDQLPTTHPIVADIPDLEAARQNFDGITYAKGASVLKQLAAYVGPAAFRDASRSYFHAHAFGNTTLKDFLRELESASGRDMGHWARTWLQTAGVPVLEVVLESSAGLVTAAHLTQSGIDPVTGEQVLRPHQLQVGVFELVDGKLLRTSSQPVALSGASVGLPFLVGQPTPALILPNDEDLTYAKLSLDAGSLATVLAHADALTDPLARASIWAALWNMVRDAALPAPDFVKAVADFAGGITDPGVFGSLMDQGIAAANSYCAPAIRDTQRSHLATTLTSVLDGAVPGSDQQLAAARAFARLARSHAASGTAELVTGLLDGTRAPSGLSIDESLRWALLQAQAAHDQISPATLDAELAAAPSADATEGHALAIAARPIPAVKAATFAAVISGSDADGNVLSNAQLSATAEGFGIGSPEQLQGYYAGYWDELERIWDERSIGLATRAIAGLFPSAQDLDATLGAENHPVLLRTAQWLEEYPNAPRALRRILIEEHDRLLRSLRAQVASIKR